ncbi:MAG: cupin domain-containing protein [Actinomycetota bacterium]
MELKRYADAAPFEFGVFTVRELSPEAFSIGSVGEIIVPIGAERDSRVSEKTHRMYVVVTGDLEFRVAGEIFRVGPGDTIHISAGEEYGFHNGGYEEGKLLLIRVPGPVRPERY